MTEPAARRDSEFFPPSRDDANSRRSMNMNTPTSFADNGITVRDVSRSRRRKREPSADDVVASGAVETLVLC